MSHHFLAFDLGAESGRSMLGSFGDGQLRLEELHRFANTPVRVFHGLYWDALRLWHEIQHGLSLALRAQPLSGLAVDTWGVDFALLGRDGALLENPRHYRDPRNTGMLEKLFAVVPRNEVFGHTGVQLMQINTLFQLYGMKLSDASALRSAAALVMMPDLFHYWLTGKVCCEMTIASTSQMYNPVECRWAFELLDRLDLPKSILPEIVAPGTQMGTALDSGVPVYATGCHDTASAVAAVPAEGEDWCYISSGTWSLMGVELDSAVVNERSASMNLTNEVGFGGKIRLLKNIPGLWLLQECRRAWSAEGRDYSYEELVRMAEAAQPFRAVLDPDAFAEAGEMPRKIAEFCAAHGQQPLRSDGEIARAIFESLALRYRQVLADLETLLGRRLGTIHIVGGGSRNHLLNQLVADATGRTVIAGPAEATAAGNLLIQAIGAGLLANMAEARQVVRHSFPVESFQPRGWAN